MIIYKQSLIQSSPRESLKCVPLSLFYRREWTHAECQHLARDVPFNSSKGRTQTSIHQAAIMCIREHRKQVFLPPFSQGGTMLGQVHKVLWGVPAGKAEFGSGPFLQLWAFSFLLQPTAYLLSRAEQLWIQSILWALVPLCPFPPDLSARSVLPGANSPSGIPHSGHERLLALRHQTWPVGFSCPFCPSSFTSGFLRLWPQCPPGLLSAPLRSSFPYSSTHQSILVS